jgi:hypothetical protein
MHTFDPFDTSKTHAIDIHFQAFSFHLIAVASGGFITINKLATAIDTDVILLTLLLTIFTDVSTVAFWALHKV